MQIKIIFTNYFWRRINGMLAISTINIACNCI